MTKRNLLGLTNSFTRDFLGMAAPFSLRFKLLMRNLYEGENAFHWDEEVPNKENCGSD